MSKPFFHRLNKYYNDVAAVLRGEAQAASVFPNTTNIGESREKIYAAFLKQHTPSKCNVFLGGFLFDEDGAESKQLDIIITTDTTPPFNFHNRDGSGKSFSPVEGTLAVVSVKSNLDKDQLFDALDNIASIPPTRELEGRLSPTVILKGYDNWPLKIIYASSGIKMDTLITHLDTFYNKNPDIPQNRRPDFIHVAGNCFIAKPTDDKVLVDLVSGERISMSVGNWCTDTARPDLHGIAWIAYSLQEKATASAHIMFKYNYLVDKTIFASEQN